MTDQLARAHLQAEHALEEAAVALKFQRRRLPEVFAALANKDIERAWGLLKQLDRRSQSALQQVKAAQVNLLGIPITTHEAARRPQGDHRDRDTARS